MKSKDKSWHEFGSFGMVFGIICVMATIVWVTVSVFSDGDRSGDDVTWVG
ncbi:hypothetical protein ACFL47_06430 [Candidatus Latescibacterota bacterium]